MATNNRFHTDDIRRNNDHLSPLKSIIETAFYTNNVQTISTLSEAYYLAKQSPRVIILDKNVSDAKKLELPQDTKILLENGTHIVGRTASARRIFGQNKDEDDKLTSLILDAIYKASNLEFISGTAIIGLDPEFMGAAHIMMPKTESPNLYSWLLNFQIKNDAYTTIYQNSKFYDDNDIYIYFNPNWDHEDYPDGLAYFDTDHNVAIILGMQYFGEIKKGTLTLAWATAVRNGYLAAHGGLKKITTKDNQQFVAAFFGLSGSGKSTLTHAKHHNKYHIEVLHDDAFIIDLENGRSIALEPSYFDKTNDYPTGHTEQDYFLTVQNVGVTLNEDNKKVLVTEDLRNKNGRTIKSRYSTPNRVDSIDEPINAIFWIMKDDTLPPLIQIDDPVIAATFGATLITKRSSAENVKNPGETVVEPYANPFRVYPLITDYNHFKDLFNTNVSCFILNTGQFLGKDIKPQTTLEVIESIVENTATLKPFGNISGMTYLALDSYELPFEDKNYLTDLLASMKNRRAFLKEHLDKESSDQLPTEAILSLDNIIKQIQLKLH